MRFNGRCLWMILCLYTTFNEYVVDNVYGFGIYLLTFKGYVKEFNEQLLMSVYGCVGTYVHKLLL